MKFEHTISGGLMKLTEMKKFNLFVFFTMLAKFSVDLFLPVILYKLNYSINFILLFLLISYIFNIIIAIPITKIGQKYSFKYLLLISLIFFVLLYLAVSFMKKSLLWFVIIVILNSLSNTMYYLSRHNYASLALNKKNKSLGVGSILNVTILASIIASLASSLLLEKISMKYVVIIVSITYFLGCLFIFKIKSPKPSTHDSILSVHKKLPLNYKIFYLLEQFKVLFFTLYPLYVYIYIQNTYTYIGILYLITGIASIIFIYFYTHKNKNGDYLKTASILLSILLFLDMLNLNKYLILIIVFLEGLFTRLYDLSITKNMYAMQKSIEGSSYFLYMEILYEIGRIVIISLVWMFKLKLKTILYICIIFILISGFINLKIED